VAVETPVSEAWETMSGPMNRTTSTSTPIRKVVLKCTPRQDLKPDQQSDTAMRSLTLKLAAKPLPSLLRPALDIEQKLVQFDNDLAAKADESGLIKQLSRMDDDFASDTVAVKEWICGNALAVMEVRESVSLKAYIAGLIFRHLAAIHDINGYGKAIYAAFRFLAAHPTEMFNHWQSACAAIQLVTIDDALALSLASSLQSALARKNFTYEISRMTASLCSAYSEVREYFFAELLSSRLAESESESDGLLLSLILQISLLKSDELTEAGLKEALMPFTEEIYKQLTNMVPGGHSPLVGILKSLPDAMAISSVVAAPVVTKYLSQFAVMLLSTDKVKLDLQARQSILESLTSIASRLRRCERQGSQGPLSLGQLSEFSSVLQEKTRLTAAYKSLFNVEEAIDSGVTLTQGHIYQVASGFLAPVTLNLIILHLRLASDPSLQMRIKAMRGLQSILDLKDPFVMREGFYKFVASKLDDASVSIRDVALEITSKCYSPQQMIDFGMVEAISQRVTDASTLVRKRAVRMHRDLLSSNLAIELQAPLVAALLGSISDEENSVAKLSLKILKEQWLMKTTASLHDRQAIVQFVALIIRAIRILGSDANSIQTFMTSCLIDSDLAGPVKELSAATVDILFESLIGSVEASSWDAVRFILNAIDIFVGQEHAYLSSHLRLLYELTKTSEMPSIEFALKLMKSSIVGCDRSVLLQLSGCPQRMAMLVLKGSEPVVRNAVEFLFAYSEIVEDASGTLGSLWERFSGFLTSHLSKNVPDSLTSAVCRGLFSLGCLTRCMSKTLSVDDAKSPVNKALSLFIEYFGNSNQMISYYALQSITALIPEQPALMFREDISQIIDRSFSCDQINFSLLSLRSFIALMEKKSFADVITFKTSMKPSEVNLSSSIIQLHMAKIVDAAFCLNDECQLLSLKILSYALVHGLCHPQQVLPTIVALSTSPIGEIATRASEVVLSAAETHSSFVFSNYSKVLNALYRLHSLYPDCIGSRDEIGGIESLFGSLYSEVRSKKTKRNDLVSVLFQEFEEAARSEGVLPRFILEMIATLPLKTFEEIAYILVKVNDLSSAVSAQVVDSEEEQDLNVLRRCLWLLQLRGYLAVTYAFSLEKCEKALINDASGKSSLSARPSEPFKPASEFESVEETLDLIRAALEEQQWIEVTYSGQRPATSKPSEVKRPSKRPRKRRPKYSLSSDEDGQQGEEVH